MAITLIIHGNADTHEKPYVCDCGERFPRRQVHFLLCTYLSHAICGVSILTPFNRDLLARHLKQPHPPQRPATTTDSHVATLRPPTSSSNDAADSDCLNASWDFDSIMQDVFADMSFCNSSFPPLMDASKESSGAPNREFTRFSSHLPSIDGLDTAPLGHDGESEVSSLLGSQASASAVPWYVSEPRYQSLCNEVQDFSGFVPALCTMPSRNSLIRYLEKYFQCVQKLLPCIHVPTFSAEHSDAELLLALSAHGAKYRFESSPAYRLYFMAKAIWTEKERRRHVALETTFILAEGLTTAQPDKERLLRPLQTLVLLTLYASQAGIYVMKEALSLSSQLPLLMKEYRTPELGDAASSDTDWQRWLAAEEGRRTVFAAYALCSLQSVAFNTPPLILSSELDFTLPSYAKQWEASSASQWRLATAPKDAQLHQAFLSLFDDTVAAWESFTDLSSFTSYLLAHALLQQINIDRQRPDWSLQTDAARSLETALQRLQACWERSPETDLDPMSVKGPLGLSSLALLRLCHVRLVSDLRPCQQLLPADIQGQAYKLSNLVRSTHLDRAVLHAAHALSQPVRHGVAFVSRVQIPMWTIEHSLCSLECALLLRDWLETIALSVILEGIESLRPDEMKLLDVTKIILEEASCESAQLESEKDVSDIHGMGREVMKVWAQIYRGDHVHDIDNSIGTLLSETS